MGFIICILYVLTPYPVWSWKLTSIPSLFPPSLSPSLLPFLFVLANTELLAPLFRKQWYLFIYFLFFYAFKYQNTEVFFYKAREDFNRINKSSCAKVTCVLCMTGFLASCTAVGPGAAWVVTGVDGQGRTWPPRGPVGSLEIQHELRCLRSWKMSLRDSLVF